MNKKIKEKFDSWDLKSLFLAIIVFSIGIFLFLYFTDIRDRFRQKDKDEFKGQTKADIISVEPMERITQGKSGTKIFIDSYKILYSYRANGQTFQKTDIVPLTLKNKKFLATILARKTSDVFMVKFDEKDAEKSILVENE